MKGKLFNYALAALSLAGLNAKAQSCGPMNPPPDDCKTCVSVNLPAPVKICPGASFNFTPSVSVPLGFTIKGYNWSGTTVTPPGGLGAPGLTSITPPTPGGPVPCGVLSYPYTLSVSALAWENILNPAFSAGNTDFCSQFYFVPPASLANTDYTICSNANTLPGWASPANFYDHTFGTPAGRMLVGQADPNVNVLWQQTVNVCPGEPYEFSYWQATPHITSTMGNVYVSIMDAGGTVTPLGSFTNSTMDLWQNAVYNWVNPGIATYTTATIYIHGGGPIPGPWGYMPSGTVYALDDISFRRVCKGVGNMTVDVEYPEITGPKRVCVGSTITLNGCPPGGTWSSTPGATVDAMGNVTGVTAGPATITYTSPLGCITTYNITINPLPVIHGTDSVCVGSSVTWTAGSVGTWTSTPQVYNWSWWVVSSSATFQGMSPGIATIIFTDSATGCTDTATIKVNPLPAPLPTIHICMGVTGVTLPMGPAGGSWSSTNPSVATVGPTGVITTIGAGTTWVTYTLPTGCSVTTSITVYNCANGGGIVGYGHLCEGQTIAFALATGIPTGGIWHSSNPAVATVDSLTGVVTAVGGGATVISYTVGGMTWTFPVNVTGNPTVTLNTSCCPYVFNFGSSCPGAIFHYHVLDQFGVWLGPPWTATTGAGSILYSTLVSTWGPTAYTVCIDAVVCAGCWFNKNICVSVNQPKPSSADDLNGTGGSIAIIPNPNRGTFTISGVLNSSGNTDKAFIDVINQVGQVVYKGEAALEHGNINKKLTLSNNLANGIYMIRIRDNEGAHILRFVLDR